jgi:hypothetical protein
MGLPKKYPNFYGRFFVNNQGIVLTSGGQGKYQAGILWEGRWSI